MLVNTVVLSSPILSGWNGVWIAFFNINATIGTQKGSTHGLNQSVVMKRGSLFKPPLTGGPTSKNITPTAPVGSNRKSSFASPRKQSIVGKGKGKEKGEETNDTSTTSAAESSGMEKDIQEQTHLKPEPESESEVEKGLIGSIVHSDSPFASKDEGGKSDGKDISDASSPTIVYAELIMPKTRLYKVLVSVLSKTSF